MTVSYFKPRSFKPLWLNSILLLCLVLTACVGGSQSSIIKRQFFQTDISTEPLLPGVAVSTAHPLATEAGLRILENGGNAFDAAVAISAALAVVEPSGSGFGGGGFWLLHREPDGKQVVIDGREKAPQAATRDMYLNDKGGVIEGASNYGALAAAIPGMPAALAHINENYGKLSLQESLQPALELAEQGFEITPRLQNFIDMRKLYFTKNTLQIFDKQSGKLVVQADLADVIRRFSVAGFDGFYKGETADKLLKGVNAGGGVWTSSDLSGYQIVERQPIRFNYRDARVVAPPLPSSGGLVLQQILQMLEYRQELVNPETPVLDYHLIVESMRRAYRDRALYMGDADFIGNDLRWLLEPFYISAQADSIDLNRATLSRHMIDAGSQLHKAVNTQQGHDTTHFSVVDAQGNRVAATLSINFPFGSCFMPTGTGIFLNNEMDDFSVKSGEPNGYSLIGGDANAIEAGKRPLSSMTPIFIEQPDQVTVIGTPGGSRIISMMTLAVLAVVDLELPIQDVVNMPRFHHQFYPDLIQHEPRAIDQVSTQALLNKGHLIKDTNRQYGNMHAVQWQRDKKQNYDLRAVNDIRGEGLGQVLWQVKE